ncbi:YhbY family RNA-binding protein [Liquorilactobacillus sicerae]|uniref:YhbY family RNA-binding protein n=1 Tax=Liquorilactobacillus sicerae TaxID=1416943 RepID=UPI002481613B|nr:YhbY family RNA-binding protein [Liquorilactobacillus sicerae]
MKKQKLNNQQKKWLKSTAHSLRPLIQIGKQGISEIWLEQLEKALNKRELLKVNLLPNAPVTESKAAELIEAKLPASVLQKIGHVLVVYQRSNDKENRYFSEKIKHLPIKE